MWALILVSTIYTSGISMHHVQFESKALCEVAAQQIKSNRKFHYVDGAICVRTK